ncbi:MMPL family transporter [Nocardioides sp.]|uniref:MMPL family transporter n=1 Tax=Nocardioides sp. TaxID=35761 RepID=UPI003D0D6EFB
MATHNPFANLPLRAARWSATHPWRAILAWLLLVAVAVLLAMSVPTVTTTDADYRLGESGRADAMISAAGLEHPDAESVLITSSSGGVLGDDALAAARGLAGELAALEAVTAVSEPAWSQDRTALLLSAQLAKDQDDAEPLQDLTAAAQERHPDLEIRQAGDLSVDAGIENQVGEDLGAAEGISLPVTVVLMLLAFGALIAAGIPVLLAVTSVAVTIGITAPLSHLVHAESTVSSMIVLIGMAVGVDYSLFYLKREREERAAGATTLDAVEIAAETSGHSIMVSGLAVIASMAGLYVIGGATFNSLATGAILVVGVAVLGSITVLPALLAKLGRWVDRPRVPLLWRLNRRVGRGGLSRRILAPVVRHPALALLISSAAVLALCVPALGMKIHSANLDTLPGTIPEVQTYRDLVDRFPQEGSTASVVATGERREVRAALADLRERARSDADFVVEAPAPIETSADGRTSRLTLAMPYAESDPRVDDAVTHLRTDLVPATLGPVTSTYAVGGGPAEALDSSDRLSTYLPIVIGFVLMLTMLMMALSFRSVPIALVSTGLNLVSVGVAFGLMTLVFQHGWGHQLLDFTTPGLIIDWIPLFVLVVLVGLSMDYHVFVLSRIREHVRRGLPARLAVEEGLVDTAGVVTSAAAVMVSVFAIFATLSMLEMKMMGVGLSAAILIDATVIRLVMLPAILILLGDRAWWPQRPQRPVGERVVEDDPAHVRLVDA